MEHLLKKSSNFVLGRQQTVSSVTNHFETIDYRMEMDQDIAINEDGFCG